MHTTQQDHAEQNSGRTAARTEIKACLAVAGGCGVIGVIGLVINWFSSGTTNLHGLLIVAGFYLVLAAMSSWKLLARAESPVNQFASAASGPEVAWSSRESHLRGVTHGRVLASERPVVNAD